MLLRLGMAALIGGALGLNRELRRKPAGLRTHALVSLGAAAVTLTILQLETDVDSNAVSRGIQGIVAGIGFLGGGVILKTSDRSSVRGLTTAASIWVVACLGIACGAGQWLTAISALTLALVVLVVGAAFERVLKRRLPARHAQHAAGEGGRRAHEQAATAPAPDTAAEVAEGAARG